MSKLILKFCWLVNAKILFRVSYIIMVVTFKRELVNYHALFQGLFLYFSKQINIFQLSPNLLEKLNYVFSILFKSPQTAFET